jgi:hypothetical protein
MMGKDFVVIGGGGGLHQPLNEKEKCLPDLAVGYKPPFHYLSVNRIADKLYVTSHAINNDFASFSEGYSFNTNSNTEAADNLAKTASLPAEESKKN